MRTKIEKKDIESEMLRRIFYIGGDLPNTGQDNRPKFVLLGTPQEFLDSLPHSTGESGSDINVGSKGEVDNGPRCAKCNNYFAHHHKVCIVDDKWYHIGCAEKLEKCGALIQATVDGPITCANPKGKCAMHAQKISDTQHVHCFYKENPHRCGSCCECGEQFSFSPREEWEEEERLVLNRIIAKWVVAPENSGKNVPGFSQILDWYVAQSLHSEKDRMRMGVEGMKHNLLSERDYNEMGIYFDLESTIELSNGVKNIFLSKVLSLIDNTDK